MKNSLIKLFILTLIFTAFSCNEDEVVFDNTQFLQVSNANAVSVVENGGQMVEIEVIIGAAQSQDTSVAWDVDGDASRFEITPNGGAVTIPAGETSVSVFFMALDNDTIDGDVDITLSLSSSSGLPVGIGGGNNPIGASKVITIIDDNVPCNNYSVTFITDRWGSEDQWDILDSNGMVVASNGPFADLGAAGTDTFTTAVVLDDGCYTFRAFDYYGDSMSSDGGSGYTLTCGSLSLSGSGAAFAGIPGLDINSVPGNANYGGLRFRAASATNVPPYTGHAAQIEFCVNQ